MTKSQVLADIQSKIKTNGNQEITGDILQGVLTESVNIIPEKTSELTNDSSYVTSAEVDTKVASKADQSSVDTLNAQVTTNTSDIATLKTEMGDVNTQLETILYGSES